MSQLLDCGKILKQDGDQSLEIFPILLKNDLENTL